MPAAGDTRYALDPDNLEQDYKAKKAQQDKATAELLKTAQKLKKLRKKNEPRKEKTI